MKLILLLAILSSSQLYLVWGQCDIRTDFSGRLSKSVYGTSSACWKIFVPDKHVIFLRNFHFSQSDDCRLNVNVNFADFNEVYKICSSENSKNQITGFSNATVTFSHSYYNYYSSVFTFDYDIKEISCLIQDSFKCDNHSCVSKDQVCDGVRNCQNGADEVGCEKGILAINGVNAARESAVSWLKSRRTPSWGWKEDTPRAIVALYLASAATFNGSVMEDELMAKQAQLKIATSLLRSKLSNSELSMFVNALLVTCHNPRHFYGIDLVRRLKTQVEQTSNFTHPLSYLALCNAKEPWPMKALDDLSDVLTSNSTYFFAPDLQSMAHMALSCAVNLSKNGTLPFDSFTLELYNNFTLRFKKLQNQDGSFGNVYTTALVTQALIAGGQENNNDWYLNRTIEYLIKEINSSSIDFLTNYLILPLLNGKTLTNIGNRNCTGITKDEDLISEIADYLGEKIRVKYSLYIGDEMDVIHTIVLRVPENFTAFEVMELAAEEDSKYRFEWQDISGKNYVYKIANITNDPEHGKFWLLYVSSSNSTDGTWKHHTEASEDVSLQDDDHLIMWFKTTSL